LVVDYVNIQLVEQEIARRPYVPAGPFVSKYPLRRLSPLPIDIHDDRDGDEIHGFTFVKRRYVQRPHNCAPTSNPLITVPEE
jgi:hypothetical protein